MYKYIRSFDLPEQLTLTRAFAQTQNNIVEQVKQCARTLMRDKYDLFYCTEIARISYCHKISYNKSVTKFKLPQQLTTAIQNNLLTEGFIMSEETECKKSKMQENSAVYREVDTQSNDDENNINYFTFLPLEIQFYIFELFDFKELLTAAKVCVTFREIVRDICQRRYRNFEYNYEDLVSRHLKDNEISDFCSLYGETIEKAHLVFHRFILNEIQIFKRNVKYFNNLLTLEVSRPALEANILDLVAKHCRNLKTLKIWHCSGEWNDRKTCFPRFECLENLEVRSHCDIDYELLITISKKAPLKYFSLHIFNYFLDTNKMLNLCSRWVYLETLKLFAFTSNNKVLKAIFNLPRLKLLELNGSEFANIVHFEENFLKILHKHSKKSLALQSIKFRNKYMEYNLQWSNKIFDNILKYFSDFKNLQTLTFQRCRPVSYNQLKRLGLCLKQLKMITICSHPEVDDKLFHQQWLNLGIECKLNFDDFFTPEFMFGSRSITCEFS